MSLTTKKPKKQTQINKLGENVGNPNEFEELEKKKPVRKATRAAEEKNEVAVGVLRWSKEGNSSPPKCALKNIRF